MDTIGSMFRKLIDAFTVEYLSVDELLEQHAELVRSVKSYAGSEQVFERAYLPCIRRLARYVYTLPASETHHHSQAGGLFAHSLDTALHGLRLFDMRSPSIRNERGYTDKMRTKKEMPKWRLSLFLALMIHDVGKVFTMSVFLERETASKKATTRDYWNPYEIALFDWLEASGRWDYEVRWERGRGKVHEKFTPLIFPYVAGVEATRWLGMEKCAHIIDAVTPIADPDNVLRGYVEAADRESASAKTRFPTVLAGPKAEAENNEGRPTPPAAPSTMRVNEDAVRRRAPAPAAKKETGPDAMPPPSDGVEAKATEDKPEPQGQEQSRRKVLHAPTGDATGHAASQQEEKSAQEEKDAPKGEAPVAEQLEGTAFVEKMRMLVEAGRISANSTEADAFVLGGKRAYWISTQALRRVLRELGVASSSIALQKAIADLAIAGVLATIGKEGKTSARASVGKRRFVVFAMPARLGKLACGNLEPFSGKISLPSNDDLNIPAAADAPADKSSRKIEASRPGQDELDARCRDVLVRLVESAPGKRSVKIPRSNFDKAVKDIAGDISPFVKKRLRKMEVLRKGDAQHVSVSLVRAREMLDELGGD